MQIFQISVIAVALAMDAFAVSIAAGITLKTISFRQTFRLAWHFGFFQALMPVIGWSAGLTVRTLIADYDHWIAFGLLAWVGIKMIQDAFHHDLPRERPKDPTRGLTLVILSIATSIDALAVGFSISLIRLSIWESALIIGLVAAAFTVMGLQLGKRARTIPRVSHFAGAAGGTLLLLLGLKILHEHGALSSIL